MFKWGIKKGVGRTNKEFQFYESFTYSGVEYFLYDCVYLYDVGSVDTYIGKLVRIFETPTKEKKVKVVWFFRPGDIRNFLGDYEPKWNELFLASGQGKGLFNVNPLEAIVDKCNVACASHDKRNPQPTEEELRMAEFIFYRCFDVGEHKILENFADHIDGIKVEFFFNKRKDQKVMVPPALKLNVEVCDHAVRDAKPGGSRPMAKESRITDALGLQGQISNENTVLRPRTPIDSDGTASCQVPYSQVDEKAKRVRFSEDSFPPNANAPEFVKKRKLIQDGKEGKVSDKEGLLVMPDGGAKTVHKISIGPDAEKRKWFKQLPWIEKLKRAEEAGTLVLLENIDPTLTSSEVEDLVWHALKLRVEAKMIQRSAFSSPHYGKALVVFESKEAAEFAISKLRTRCLVMTDGRPIIGSKGSLKDTGKPFGFTGHLSLPEISRKWRTEEMRKAVSTSHLSQPNTIEHEMAIEWRLLHEKSDEWWNELHRRQAKEIEDVKSLLKMNYMNWRI